MAGVEGVWMRWSNRQFIRIDIQHDKSEWFPILLCLTEDVCCEVRASKRMRWYVNTTTTHYSDAFAASWANCFGCTEAKDVGDSAPKIVAVYAQSCQRPKDKMHWLGESFEFHFRFNRWHCIVLNSAISFSLSSIRLRISDFFFRSFFLWHDVIFVLFERFCHQNFEEVQRNGHKMCFFFLLSESELANGFHHRIGALIFCTKGNPPFSCLFCHSKS